MMTVTKTGVLLLLMLQDVLGASEDPLWCYECGTGVAGEPNCEDFAHASSWATFWRKCPKDYICVKSLPSWDTGDESHIVRGCSPRVNLRGDHHKKGCWSHSSSSILTCFCDTDRCNHAYAPTPTPTILTLATLLVLCVGVRC